MHLEILGFPTFFFTVSHFKLLVPIGLVAAVFSPVLYLETNSIKLRKSFPKKGKRKVQGVPQSQTAALPRHQEEEETDKSTQAQIDQTYEKH